MHQSSATRARATKEKQMPKEDEEDKSERSENGPAEWRPAKALVQQAFLQIEDWYQHQRHVGGVSTGLEALDSSTGGWQSRQLITVAARSAVVRSDFLRHCALHAARHRVPTLLCAPMQEGAQIFLRMLRRLAGIDPRRLQQGMLNEKEWARLVRESAGLSEMPLVVDDRRPLSCSASIRNPHRRQLKFPTSSRRHSGTITA